MITLTHVYWVLGAYFASIAWRGFRDRGNPRRHTTALFWGVLALLLFAAERLPAAAVGVLVIGLALLAGLGGLRMGRYEESSVQEKQAENYRGLQGKGKGDNKLPGAMLGVAAGQAF